MFLICLDLAASSANMSSWRVDGVTILWPTNGLLLGVLLCAPRRQWAAYFTVGFSVDLSTNLFLRFGFWSSAYIAGCNMLEAGLAAVLLYRTISPRPDLLERRQLLRLVCYGMILAPAVASLLAQFNPADASSSHLFTSFKHWFTADALGIAVMTPLYLSLHRGRKFMGRSWPEVAGLLMLMLLATVAVFWQSSLPSLFLLTPFLLLLGFRLRLVGSATGLLMVAIVGGILTSKGRGPIVLMHERAESSHDLFLQFFIAVSMLVLYGIDIVVGEAEIRQANLKTSENRFRLLAEASNDVIMLSDLWGRRRYVSPAVSAMLGWQPEELLGYDHRQLVHPDDWPKIVKLFEDCRMGVITDALPYRCRERGGSYVWVEASIRLCHDVGTGDAEGFVNVVRDISSRKAAEDELNKAFSAVSSLVMVDGLTGVANRRRFDEKMELELRRAQFEGSMISLLMMDVDHFKAYNDRYGHVRGDACLREIAAVAQQTILRNADLFARYGGEEFVAVLPGTDCRGSKSLAEEIRSRVEACRIPHSASPHGVVTVSIGFASQTLGPQSDGSLLLLEADEALYRAKSAGRNRVVGEMLVASPK